MLDVILLAMHVVKKRLCPLQPIDVAGVGTLSATTFLFIANDNLTSRCTCIMLIVAVLAQTSLSAIQHNNEF